MPDRDRILIPSNTFFRYSHQGFYYHLEGICSYLKIKSFIADILKNISSINNNKPGIRKNDPNTIPVIDKPLPLLLQRPAFILLKSILPHIIEVKGKPIESIKTIISLVNNVSKLITWKEEDHLKIRDMDTTLSKPVTKAAIDNPLYFSNLALSFILWFPFLNNFGYWYI